MPDWGALDSRQVIRHLRSVILAAILLVVAMSCISGAKVDVNALCNVHLTNAKLVLTKGSVIPADLTRTIGAAPARHLYGTVCRAMVTAPAVPEGKVVHCPGSRVAPGTAKVVFFANNRQVDAVDVGVTGCVAMLSKRLGRLPEFGDDIPNFETVTRAIHRAFDVTDEQFGRQ